MKPDDNPIVETSKVTFPDLSIDKFARDLNDCHIAWIAYAEVRFGKPVQVKLTPEQVKERFGLSTEGRGYSEYTYMETAPGWTEAHDHFTVAFMTARGHKLDMTTGNWSTWLE